jgi:glycosyltransferase involved in cell wall biosynthesis
MRVDQWVPALHRGDAIGDSARLMRDAFRSWGHAADVFALELDEDLEGDGRRWAEWRTGAPDDVVLLHYALPSPLTPALREVACRRIVLHHNITPPEFFAGWDAELTRICELGRRELPTLRGVELGLADSEYNRLELEAAGFAPTGVLPIAMDFARYREPPDPVRWRMLRDGRTNLLFVGRLSPNKGHGDLIRLAAAWRRFVDPGVRLLLVGKPPRRPGYLHALHALARSLGLGPSDVVFTGHVDHAELVACYRAAHLFVSMSEHEGFGVPLVEAMLLDVPVLAFRCTAVGDTLGGAGVQFGEKRLPEVLELGAALVGDAALRERVLRGQRERLAAFEPMRVMETLRGHLESLG